MRLSADSFETSAVFETAADMASAKHRLKFVRERARHGRGTGAARARHGRGTGTAHTGLNLPKRFTNPRVLDSSGPQNEKGLSYRKQKSCLGSNLNFAFYTCLPHFTLRQF